MRLDSQHKSRAITAKEMHQHENSEKNLRRRKSLLSSSQHRSYRRQLVWIRFKTYAQVQNICCLSHRRAPTYGENCWMSLKYAWASLWVRGFEEYPDLFSIVGKVLFRCYFSSICDHYPTCIKNPSRMKKKQQNYFLALLNLAALKCKCRWFSFTSHTTQLHERYICHIFSTLWAALSSLYVHLESRQDVLNFVSWSEHVVLKSYWKLQMQ